MINLRTLLISILLSILSGLPISSFADDTEIYSRKVEVVNTSEGTNILFMLDNSGSMNRVITDDTGKPSGYRRIDVLKEALDKMLDAASNVNMGLGRFAALINANSPPVNAPIIFPVEFIDKDITELEGEETDSIGDITVSIIQGSDDAEQFEESGEMILYEPDLDMIIRQNEVVSYDGDEVKSASVTTEKFVYNGGDDAEEFLNDEHTLKTGKDILYLGTHPKTATVLNETNMLVGLRFRDLNIPPKTKILAADIEFFSTDSREATDNLNIAIYGAANDGLYIKDPSGVTFNHSCYRNGRDENACINGTSEGYLTGEGYPEDKINFPLITDSNDEIIKVLWNEADKVGTGQAFNSANIKDIIQAIIDRDGWNDGTDKHHPYNSLVLLLQKDGNNPPIDLINGRSFYSADNIDKIPPKIRITWERNGAPTSIAKTHSDVRNQRKSNVINDGWYSSINNIAVSLGRCVLFNEGYCSKGGMHNEVLAGMRFSNLDIPKNAEITSARITFTHQNSIGIKTNSILDSPLGSKKDLDLFIYAEDSPNPDNYSAGQIATREKMDPAINWNDVAKPPVKLYESISWDGIEYLPTGLKTTWDGEGEIPTEYCSKDENGMITDADCIKFTTPDLTSIVQKIVERESWKRENSIAFMFEVNAARDGSKELIDLEKVGFRRIVAPNDDGNKFGGKIQSYIDTEPDSTTFNSTTLPKLEVTYQIAFQENVSEKQQVGLRFEAIDIPRGANVENAYLTFNSAEDTTDDTINADLIIQAETTSSATFTEEPFNISNRELTTASVSWSPNKWSKGLSYESPDLKNIIQEVVDSSDWCSGDLSFIITSDDLSSIRKASSFDYMSGLSPELRVRFDTENIKPGGGCVNQTYYSKISERFDDAEEKTSGSEDGLVYLASEILETGVRDQESRLIGFRFREIPVGNGAEVVGANLMVSAYAKNSADATFQVYGELSPNPKEFSADDNNLSSREPKTSKVEWVPKIWEKGKIYRTPNIASVLQDIVNQAEWKAYGDIVLLIENGSNSRSRRDIVSFDNNQALAATLRIQVKGKLGEDGKGDILTVRRRLQSLVKRMRIPNSRTPIVGALFESAQYYLGKKVVNGKSRNNESFHLVSHPATHDSENIIPAGCNINLNPYAAECAGEEIAGIANYTPPSRSNSSCQSSHIVLLTDGRANVTKAQAITQKNNAITLLPNSSCINSFELNGKNIKISEDEACGIDLADYIATEHNIIVHTIGFQLGTAWYGRYRVGDSYVVGPKNGEYYDITETATEISTTDLKGRYISNSKRGSVLNYVKEKDETVDNLKAVDYLCRLASPGSGNYEQCSGRNFYLAKTVEELETAFTNIGAQATTTNSSFAAPSISVDNLNKLRHKNDVYYSVFRPTPEPRWHGNIKRYKFIDGSLKDSRNNEATDEDGYIADGTKSFWSNLDDGGNVTAGGIGGKLSSADRKIYTYLGSLAIGRNHNKDLKQIEEFDETPTIFQKKLIPELLKHDNDDVAVETTEATEEARLEKAKTIVKWILGKDTTVGEGSSTVNQSDTEESEESQDTIEIKTSGDRWPIAEPLHSSPRVLFYSGDPESKDNGDTKSEESRLFVGTNDGLIRMTDVFDGTEVWSFLPQELLEKQLDMKDQVGSSHSYGIDASPTFFVNTSDGQIIPTLGNFATMFVGMRRGGRNIYALDVTDKDNPPKLMWTIKGGETEGKDNFTRLGQTWSAPIVTDVHESYCDYAWCKVVMFAGGYDPIADGENKFNPIKNVTMGNAIYMVDPETGELLWWAGNDDKADLKLKDMKYAIPSDLLLQDTTGDGSTDRIYVGDIAGQLWRINLDTKEDTVGGVMAKLGEITSNGPNRRSFFYPPALARINSTSILTAVTGARPNPLALGTSGGGGYYAHDQFYAILDPTKVFNFNKPIILNNLENVTDWNEGDINLQDTDKDGWYFNLQESDEAWIGEKGLGRPLVLDENVFFITYVPPSSATTKTIDGGCGTFNPGSSRFYAINLLDGGPAFKKKEDGSGYDETERGTSSSDRALEVSTLSFDPIVMYTKDLEEAVFAGTELIMKSPVPPARVFWMQK